MFAPDALSRDHRAITSTRNSLLLGKFQPEFLETGEVYSENECRTRH